MPLQDIFVPSVGTLVGLYRRHRRGRICQRGRFNSVVTKEGVGCPRIRFTSVPRNVPHSLISLTIKPREKRHDI